MVVRWLGVIGFFSLTLWVWFGVALVVFAPHPVHGNVPPAVAACIMLPVYIAWVRAIIKGRGITCVKCVITYCLGFIVLMLYVRGLQLGDDVVTICQPPHLIDRQRYRLLAIGFAGILVGSLFNWMACLEYLSPKMPSNRKGTSCGRC